MVKISLHAHTNTAQHHHITQYHNEFGTRSSGRGSIERIEGRPIDRDVLQSFQASWPGGFRKRKESKIKRIKKKPHPFHISLRLSPPILPKSSINPRRSLLEMNQPLANGPWIIDHWQKHWKITCAEKTLVKICLVRYSVDKISSGKMLK